jgi:hypothetical protein
VCLLVSLLVCWLVLVAGIQTGTGLGVPWYNGTTGTSEVRPPLVFDLPSGHLCWFLLVALICPLDFSLYVAGYMI